MTLTIAYILMLAALNFDLCDYFRLFSLILACFHFSEARIMLIRLITRSELGNFTYA